MCKYELDGIDEAERVYSGYDDTDEEMEKNEENRQKKNYSIGPSGTMKKIFQNYGLDSTDETIGMKLDFETERQLFVDAKSKNKKKSEQAKNWIVRQYIKLVISVVHTRFATYWEGHCLNLVQAGLQGVMYAAIKGKVDLDCKTGSFATQLANWIIHHATEYITSEVHQKKAYYAIEEKKVNAARDRLQKNGNTNPSVLDISVEAGLRTSQVEKIIKSACAANHISIEGGDLDIADKSYRANPEDVAGDKEKRDTFRKVINSTLSEKERIVIILKHGLFGLEPRKNTYIQGIIGGTLSDVTVYEQSAMLKLNLNPALRAYYNCNDSIGADLAYEPIAVTPNNSAKMMMQDILEADDVDF